MPNASNFKRGMTKLDYIDVQNAKAKTSVISYHRVPPMALPPTATPKGVPGVPERGYKIYIYLC